MDGNRNNNPCGGSVSRWIPGLKAGESRAIERLWQRYIPDLTTLAWQCLAGLPGRGIAAEDVAVEAFLSFWRRAAAGKFQELQTRRNVWALLATITIRKAFNLLKRELRRRETVRCLPAAGGAGLDGWPGKEPGPEFAARVGSLLELLPEDLRPFAVLRMEGHSNEEIARLRGCGLSTVERKMGRIRGLWRSQLEDA